MDAQEIEEQTATNEERIIQKPSKPIPPPKPIVYSPRTSMSSNDEKKNVEQTKQDDIPTKTAIVKKLLINTDNSVPSKNEKLDEFVKSKSIDDLILPPPPDYFFTSDSDYTSKDSLSELPSVPHSNETHWRQQGLNIFGDSNKTNSLSKSFDSLDKRDIPTSHQYEINIYNTLPPAIQQPQQFQPYQYSQVMSKNQPYVPQIQNYTNSLTYPYNNPNVVGLPSEPSNRRTYERRFSSNPFINYSHSSNPFLCDESQFYDSDNNTNIHFNNIPDNPPPISFTSPLHDIYLPNYEQNTNFSSGNVTSETKTEEMGLPPPLPKTAPPYEEMSDLKSTSKNFSSKIPPPLPISPPPLHRMNQPKFTLKKNAMKGSLSQDQLEVVDSGKNVKELDAQSIERPKSLIFNKKFDIFETSSKVCRYLF